MGRKPSPKRLSPAIAELLANTSGVELHGPSLRIWFMWRNKRWRETLGLEPTKSNIKHAIGLRASIKHSIKIGTFNYADWFPESENAKGMAKSNRNLRVDEAAERYMKLKSIDITDETASRYQTAIDMVVEVLGASVLTTTLMPEDIQMMRGEFAATRQVSTANHYLAVAAGWLTWCHQNEYTASDLSPACERIKAEDVDPDPFTHDEFAALIGDGCLHLQDRAAVTLAIYTGLRPGELCGLAREDVDIAQGCLTVRRSVQKHRMFKVPKTKTSRDRVIWLLPPALEACKALLEMTADIAPLEIVVALNRHQTRQETVAPLLSPTIQARQENIHPFFNPHSWNKKIHAIMRRAGVRRRRPYQTRHTFACWSLTAHGNLAFIAKQMGHKDYSMLVKVYAKWIDTESQSEAERIWIEMQKRGAFAPLMPHRKTE